MNELAKRQIQDDYRKILRSEAGMRVLGGIFYRGLLTRPGFLTEYQQGQRSLVMQIANTIYEVNPYGVADCLTAYEEFMKEYAEDERRDNTDDYDE